MIRCGDHTQYLNQGPFIRKISCLNNKKEGNLWESQGSKCWAKFLSGGKKKKDRKRKGSKLNLLVCEAAVDIDKGTQCNSNNKLLSLTLHSTFNPFKWTTQMYPKQKFRIIVCPIMGGTHAVDSWGKHQYKQSKTKRKVPGILLDNWLFQQGSNSRTIFWALLCDNNKDMSQIKGPCE